MSTTVLLINIIFIYITIIGINLLIMLICSFCGRSINLFEIICDIITLRNDPAHPIETLDHFSNFRHLPSEVSEGKNKGKNNTN